ncbi:unnamed protein product [Cyclocybe aegerita]|uniref:Uncharacterized protein n=1 Tax=Cyclocybe aegerita TaxID=1973307 RepID=A0A8S0WT47_CYCAE|nr:unnamed protein product [Cyclocybe aegerita]
MYINLQQAVYCFSQVAYDIYSVLCEFSFGDGKGRVLPLPLSLAFITLSSRFHHLKMTEPIAEPTYATYVGGEVQHESDHIDSTHNSTQFSNHAQVPDLSDVGDNPKWIYIETRRPPSDVNLDVLFAPMRMGFNYKIEMLYQCALGHLVTGFPGTLQKWDKRNSQRTFRLHGSAGEDLKILYYLIHCDAWWILPATAYHFLTFDRLKNILAAPIWAYFKKEHQDKLLLGYVEQLTAHRRISQFIPGIPVRGCSNYWGCTKVAKKWFASMARERQNDPLAMPSNYRESIKQIYPECRHQCRKRHEAAREAFWERLPGLLFDGIGRDTLREKKHAAK